MQAILLIYSDEAAWAAMPAEALAGHMAAYRAYSEAMRAAGIMRGGERLLPAGSAARVQVAQGRTEVLDGPYSETKEQLGGFFIIEVPDMDTALAWAARCPGAAHGTVEVRPLWQMAAAAA
jgi:hypothetical protein